VLTSRVEGRGDSLVLVNLVRTAIIPISVIATVDRTNGVRVVLADGRRLGCIGYGSSVIALFTGNRRGNRLAAVIDGWLADRPPVDIKPTIGARLRLRTEAIACQLSVR